MVSRLPAVWAWLGLSRRPSGASPAARVWRQGAAAKCSACGCELSHCFLAATPFQVREGLQADVGLRRPPQDAGAAAEAMTSIDPTVTPPRTRRGPFELHLSTSVGNRGHKIFKVGASRPGVPGPTRPGERGPTTARPGWTAGWLSWACEGVLHWLAVTLDAWDLPPPATCPLTHRHHPWFPGGRSPFLAPGPCRPPPDGACPPARPCRPAVRPRARRSRGSRRSPAGRAGSVVATCGCCGGVAWLQSGHSSSRDPAGVPLAAAPRARPLAVALPPRLPCVGSGCRGGIRRGRHRRTRSPSGGGLVAVCARSGRGSFAGWPVVGWCRAGAGCPAPPGPGPTRQVTSWPAPPSRPMAALKVGVGYRLWPPPGPPGRGPVAVRSSSGCGWRRVGHTACHSGAIHRSAIAPGPATKARRHGTCTRLRPVTTDHPPRLARARVPRLRSLLLPGRWWSRE